MSLMENLIEICVICKIQAARTKTKADCKGCKIVEMEKLTPEFDCGANTIQRKIEERFKLKVDWESEYIKFSVDRNTGYGRLVYNFQIKPGVILCLSYNDDYTLHNAILLIRKLDYDFVIPLL